MECTWHGHRIVVEAYKLARRAWITTSIDVLVDGNPVLKSGGKVQLTGTCSEIFRQQDGDHSVDLSWGNSFWGASFPVTLTIDGVEICSGRVRVRRWYLQWLLCTVALGICLVSLWAELAGITTQ